MHATAPASVMPINERLILVLHRAHVRDSRSRWLRLILPRMQPNLSPEDHATIATLLRETIAADRFPRSPRVRRRKADDAAIRLSDALGSNRGSKAG
jgi:hypothetical protein